MDPLHTTRRHPPFPSLNSLKVPHRLYIKLSKYATVENRCIHSQLCTSFLNSQPSRPRKKCGLYRKGEGRQRNPSLPHSQLDYPKLGLPELVYLPLLPSDDGDMGGVNLHTLLTSVTVSIHSQMLLSLTRD